MLELKELDRGYTRMPHSINNHSWRIYNCVDWGMICLSQCTDIRPRYFEAFEGPMPCNPEPHWVPEIRYPEVLLVEGEKRWHEISWKKAEARLLASMEKMAVDEERI